MDPEVEKRLLERERRRRREAKSAAGANDGRRGAAALLGWGLAFVLIAVFLSTAAIYGATGTFVWSVGGEPQFEAQGLNHFLVNLSGNQSRDYVKISFSFGGYGNALEEELAQREPEIRDYIIRHLKDKTRQDFETGADLDVLKGEILGGLQEDLGIGTIEELFITEVLVQ